MTFLAALAVVFLPRLLTGKADHPETGILRQPSLYTSRGTGTYLLFENVRALMADKDLELDVFSPARSSGNLVWIEHTTTCSEPGTFDEIAITKILIQLPNQINAGDEFDIYVFAE